MEANYSLVDMVGPDNEMTTALLNIGAALANIHKRLDVLEERTRPPPGRQCHRCRDDFDQCHCMGGPFADEAACDAHDKMLDRHHNETCVQCGRRVSKGEKCRVCYEKRMCVHCGTMRGNEMHACYRVSKQ